MPKKFHDSIKPPSEPHPHDVALGSLAMRRVLPTILACRYVGLSPTKWYRMVRAGEAPAPIQLASRRLGWRVNDLEQWLESRRRFPACGIARGATRTEA